MPPISRRRSRSDNVADNHNEAPVCTNDVEMMVNKELQNAGITQTQMKGGWCLKEGLLHVCSANECSLLHLLHVPTFYRLSKDQCRHSPSPTNNMKAPSTAFQSLCRIVAGQQLAGTSAQAVWERLLKTTDYNLTPKAILSLTENGDSVLLVDRLQKPVGLSLAKARSILDLSQHFVRGDLSENLLKTASEEDIRKALSPVFGLGHWSCDTFLMFTLERSNIMPVGDLGVRKGLRKAFSLKGSGKGGSLCPQKEKDLRQIQEAVEPYAPYQSLLSCFMWKATDTVDTDTVDFYNSPAKKRKKTNAVTP